MIGCDCAVCRSTDPRDKRLRPSIYLDVPVIREPPRRYQARPSAAGADLRSARTSMRFSSRTATPITSSASTRCAASTRFRAGPIPCYASPSTWETLRQTFHYIFDGVPRLGGGIPQLDAHEIRGPFAGQRRARRAGAAVARADAGARVSASATSRTSPTATASTTRPGRSSKAWTRWSSTRCATSRTRRTSP